MLAKMAQKDQSGQKECPPLFLLVLYSFEQLIGLLPLLEVCSKSQQCFLWLVLNLETSKLSFIMHLKQDRPRRQRQQAQLVSLCRSTEFDLFPKDGETSSRQVSLFIHPVGQIIPFHSQTGFLWGSAYLPLPATLFLQEDTPPSCPTEKPHRLQT